MAKGKPSAKLFNLSRVVRNIEVWTSGDPKKIGRRYKNRYIGRNFVRKIWRWP